MEVKIGPFTFFSNFDSGNLAKVERVNREQNGNGVMMQEQPNSNGNNNNEVPLLSPDFEYRMWTAPDCSGSEYENLNRTWFYFGVKGCQAGKLVKFNLMNLNKQGKLYSQGMSPFVKVIPCRNKWERIRERPTYEIVDGQFQLSFFYRFPDQRNVVCYFAFCYPFSYEETQLYLQQFDKKLPDWSSGQQEGCRKSSAIYYYRELLCKSIDGLRVDLLTITSPSGMLQEREPRLKGLFPDPNVKRPNQFRGKKIFVLTSRVHPGETPASYVFKGFLDFITRENDPRAIVLRDRFVFKLVPLLNPDGVKRGHYRTDQRGVNLNRVYQEPSLDLHPSVYAVRALVAYYNGQCLVSGDNLGEEGVVGDIEMNGIANGVKLRDNKQLQDGQNEDGCCEGNKEDRGGSGAITEVCNLEEVQTKNKENNGGSGAIIEVCNLKEVQTKNKEDKQSIEIEGEQCSVESVCVKNIDGNDQKNLECSEGSDSACDVTYNTGENSSGEMSPVYLIQPDASTISGENQDVSKVVMPATVKSSDVSESGVSLNKDSSQLDELQDVYVSPKDDSNMSSAVEDKQENETNDNVIDAEQLTCKSHETESNENLDIKPQLSHKVSSDRLGFYVDLHGHASKRGCFIYGNYLDNEEQYVQSILFPKLISINSAHFDFTACNFTEKNMYSRDKRDGMSKEGSGRVAMYKLTGSPHCYTLECNYNSGRTTNVVPPATCDGGCATPPPPPGFPPRFTTEMYEEVGRAVAISALDMVNANPWSRLPNSEHGCLEGVRAWVSRYVKGCNKNGPAIQKKNQKATMKPPWCNITNVAPLPNRLSVQRYVLPNDDINVQNGNDSSALNTKTDEKTGVPIQRSVIKVQCVSNKKFSTITSPGRNQISPRTKDFGRKRLTVTTTAPLLMITPGDKNVHQVKLGRCENKFFANKQESFLNYDRQKSNSIKKLRNNLASVRMESVADGNGNYENERKSKLQDIMSVKQIDSNNAGTLIEHKRDLTSESLTTKEEKVKVTDKIVKRPIMSRRRRTKRTIQTDSNKVSCEVVDVKLMPGNDVTAAKNSSQVSL